MVTKAKSWIDTNKGFVITVLMLIISGAIAFTNVKSVAQGNKSDVTELKKQFDSARDVNHDQTTQLVVIRNEIKHIRESIKDTQAVQRKMNEKLDRLLQRE